MLPQFVRPKSVEILSGILFMLKIIANLNILGTKSANGNQVNKPHIMYLGTQNALS